MSKVTVLRSIINGAKGKVIGVDFRKKDGSLRTMSFRTGVSKHVKGTKPETSKTRKKTLTDNGMIGVYEMRGTDSRYRTVNLNTVEGIRVEGVNIPVNF